jgi:ankyrin repeat protein
MKKFLVLLFLAIFALSANAYTREEAELILFGKDIEPDSSTEFGRAVIRGDYELLQVMIDVEQIDLDKRYLGCNPLFYAVTNKQDKMAMFLLENGADPNVKTKDGGSSLFYAVKHGNTELVRKMLERKGMNINRHRMLFRLPLTTTAKRNGYNEIYEMLVNYKKEYKKSKE